MVDLLKKSNEGLKILTKNGVNVEEWKETSSMTPEQVSDFALAISFGEKGTSNKYLALYDVIHFNCNPEKLYSFLFDDFQCTFEKLLGENFDSASQKIHGNEVFNILQEELKLPSDSSSLNQNKSTIPLPTQPVPSVLDNQENKLSFVPYDGEGWFSKNKNFYITYGGKSYALKIGTSPEKLTLMDQTYIDGDRIQDQKIFQIKIIYH